MPHRVVSNLLNQASSAALLENDDGVCIHANRAAEALLGYDAGALNSRPVATIFQAAGSSVEYERRREDSFWYGPRDLIGAGKDTIPVRSVAFTRVSPDGPSLYIHLLYPAKKEDKLTSERHQLSARDRCLLSLMIEGFSDQQLAVLLAIDEETLGSMVRGCCRAMNTASRTEACVRALKAGLVA